MHVPLQALLLTHGFVYAGGLATKLVSLLESFKALVQPSVYSLNNVKAWFTDAADRRFVFYYKTIDLIYCWNFRNFKFVKL